MSREVELVVRLKDEVSKFASSVVDSLKDITNVQDDLGKGAGKTSTLLGQLGKEFKDLNDEAKRLTSLNKIAEGLDRSAVAVKTLETNVKSSVQEFANLARESQKAATLADKLRGSLDGEQKALKESLNARRSASKELTEANRAVAQAEKNQERYNAALAKQPKPQSGIRSAGAFINADVDRSRAVQAQLTRDVAQYEADINRSRQAIDALRPQVQAAAKQQGELANETERVSGALAKSREGLERARGAYAGIQKSANDASTAMGGMAITQENVAKSSARAAGELARTKAQIDALNQAARTTASASSVDISSDTKDAASRRAAIERLRELRKEMASAQADAQRLNAAFKSTSQPTEAMGAAAGTAAVRVRTLGEEQARLRIGLRASEGGFRSWSQAAGTMRTATAGAAIAATGLASASSQAASGIRPMGSAAQAAAQGLKSAQGGANGLRDAFNGIYGESRKALSLMQRVRGEVLSLTAGYLGLNAAVNNIGGVIKSFQTLEAAQNRLGAVFNQDTGRVAQELQFLERQADRLGIQFGLLSDQYAKFSIAAKAANFETEATRKIFLSVAEAGRVNKLSTEQLEGVFLALEQMISKGKVSSEELRRQLGDRLPGAFNIFADALGVTTAQLDDMMRKGEVLSTQSNLLKFAQQLDKRFGGQLAASLQSTTTELGRFSNNIYQAQLQVAQGGFIEGFTEALRKMNSYFQSREGRDFFMSLGASLGNFAKALAEIPPYFEQIKLGIQVFAAVKIAGVLSNIIGSFKNAASAAGAFSTQVNLIGPPTRTFVQQQTALNRVMAASVARIDGWRASLATAGGGLRGLGVGLTGLRSIVIGMTGLFRGLWAAVGGLPGLILTGITVALGQWFSQIESATSALDEHQRQMQAVIGTYEEAKGKAVDWGKAVKGITVSQAEDNLSKLLDSYDEKFSDLKGRASELETAVKAIRESSNGFGSGVDKKDLEEIERLLSLLNLLDQKKINLDQFRQGLDGIARSTKQEGLKDLAVDMQNFLDAADENGTSLDTLASAIEKTEARIRLLKGEATDTDKALLGLTEATEKTTDATDYLKENGAKLNEAFAEMGKLIATTSDELKRLETINGLDKQYQDAVKLARTMSEVNGLTDQYNKALNSTLDNSFTGNSSLVDRITGIESGGNASAKNPDSTATGLGQFIESTWLRMFKQYFPDRAAGLSDAMILELRKNATISREMVALYVQENAKILKEAGVAITDANLYLAHFLGPGGATKLLSAPKGTKVDDVLAPGQISANKSILGGGRKVEDVIAWAQRKVGISQEEIAINKELAEQDQKRSEKAKEYNADLENRLSLQENENANAGRLTQEAFVQKRLAEEQKKAKAADQVLDEATIERIKRAAAAEYQVTQAKREGKSETQEANVALQQAIALNQQRNALQQQFNEAQKTGDLTTATSLQTQLTDVNLKLQEAIANAEAMWQKIGGPEADVALTKLETLKIKADAGANSMTFFGLSTQQVGNLAGSFADGLVGVFDSFAQAIANGENAMQALGKAFLQFAADFLREIATMILKQLILNALQSFGIPGLGGATGHTGGIVGSGSIGVGNEKRKVSPAIFAGAMRYHTGGVAGLRPNEVPAILNKGEEILTEDNPRHRNNAGQQESGGSAAPQTIRVVNVLSDDVAEQMMNGSTGERVFMSHAKKNAATLRMLLK